MPPLKRHPNDLRSQVATLAPYAAAVDVARHRLAQVADTGRARERFNEALRRAEAQPSEENLRLLEAASKKMRADAGAAKKERLEKELADATHKLKLELGRLASNVKAAS